MRKAVQPESELAPLYAALALDPDHGGTKKLSSDPDDANVVPLGYFKPRNLLMYNNEFRPMLKMG
jgi:hypothetical protein